MAQNLSHLGVEYAKLLAWKKLVERFILKKHTIKNGVICN
jgi:hypothetical protein